MDKEQMKQHIKDGDEEVMSPPLRDYVFTLVEEAGESLYGIYISDWLKDMDPGSKAVMRYGLAGKKLKTQKIHFVLFVQLKEQGIVILKEGECDDLRFRKIWTEFLKDYRKQFHANLLHSFYDLVSAEKEKKGRSERLFSSIISMEN
jgi:hypothetical protein